MKVYRLEHNKTGEGPFRTGCAKTHHYDPPGPQTDGIFKDPDYWTLSTYNPEELHAHYYGFKSPEQMVKWFGLRDIEEFGKKNRVFITEYEIDDKKVKFGGHQVAFKKKETYKSKRVPFKKLFPKEKINEVSAAQVPQSSANDNDPRPEECPRWSAGRLVNAPWRWDVLKEVYRRAIEQATSQGKNQAVETKEATDGSNDIQRRDHQRVA